MEGPKSLMLSPTEEVSFPRWTGYKSPNLPPGVSPWLSIWQCNCLLLYMLPPLPLSIRRRTKLKLAIWPYSLLKCELLNDILAFIKITSLKYFVIVTQNSRTKDVSACVRHNKASCTTRHFPPLDYTVATIRSYRFPQSYHATKEDKTIQNRQKA